VRSAGEKRDYPGSVTVFHLVGLNLHGEVVVCANVYGLCWSESLLARMECAALFSPLVIQSRETSSGYGFGERRVSSRFSISIRAAMR
jgi:hypothetical protein